MRRVLIIHILRGSRINDILIRRIIFPLFSNLEEYETRLEIEKIGSGIAKRFPRVTTMIRLEASLRPVTTRTSINREANFTLNRARPENMQEDRVV